ncbi:hypothetical protein PIB30_088742, partial [Stylosanthes scabra]|nr:hypothetical protein [Stylosanthes scabra]
MLCPFFVLVPSSVSDEARKHGIAVKDRKITKSLCLHRVKNEETRKRNICRFKITAWPNSNPTRNSSISEFLYTALSISCSTIVAFLMMRLSHECILKLRRCVVFGVIDLPLAVAYFLKESRIHS